MTQDATAASLLRSVGLLADGPAVWGRPFPAQGPGVFVVELPAPLASAPTELTRIGKWIERITTLRLDGERPTSRVLATRLGSFWLPSQTILYIGASETSVARRVAAIARTELGDRRPASGANWLHTLRSLDGVKVWWAATAATEEYEDALLTAFAAGVPEADRVGLPDPAIVLPWANLRRPTGERKPTGLTGSLVAEVIEPAAPPRRVGRLPDGDADGANGEPPAPRRRAAAPRAAKAPRVAGAGAGSPAALVRVSFPAPAPASAAPAASLDGALASCDVIGGTAPARVMSALAAARSRLDEAGGP